MDNPTIPEQPPSLPPSICSDCHSAAPGLFHTPFRGVQTPFHPRCLLGLDDPETQFVSLGLVESIATGFYFFVLQFLHSHHAVAQKMALTMAVFALQLLAQSIIKTNVLIAIVCLGVGIFHNVVLRNRREAAELAVYYGFMRWGTTMGGWFFVAPPPAVTVHTMVLQFTLIYLQISMFLRGAEVLRCAVLYSEHVYRQIAGKMLVTVEADTLVFSSALVGLLWYWMIRSEIYEIQHMVVGIGLASSLWVMAPVSRVPVGVDLRAVLF